MAAPARTPDPPRFARRDYEGSVTSADLQRVFHEHGPERDRHTEWWRCTEEPWASFAQIVGHR